MYGRPRPATSSVLPSRPSQPGSGSGGSEPADAGDFREVCADATDPLEVLIDLLHRIERLAAVSVELLGEEDILGRLDRVLQQAVDEDDVDPDELAAISDRLGRDLADVRDELQLQIVGLLAGVARAQIGRDVLALVVKRAVHAGDGLRHGGGRRGGVEGVGPTREESRVAFDLDQLEVAGGVDHRLEQPRGVDLGVGEAHPVGPHVLGVTADVGDQEKRAL